MSHLRVLFGTIFLGVTAGLMGTVGSLTLMSAFGSEPHARVVLQIQEKAASTGALSAGKNHLRFTLLDSKNKRRLSDRDLSLTHTKLLHLISYDASLREFRHEHPIFRDGVWQVDVDYPVNGQYWVWAQGTIRSGQVEFSAPEHFQVAGGLPEHSGNVGGSVSLGDQRKGIDRNSIAELQASDLHAGQVTMLTLKLSRADAQASQIKPYLGALAHVILVSADGATLLHVHPMDTGQKNTLMLHTEFPKPGDYRVWTQFIDRGELKTVPLSVQVVR